MKKPNLALLLLAVAGCVSTPDASPSATANAIASALRGMRVEDAETLFADVEAYSEYVDKIYPVVYQSAQLHYESADYGRTSAALRFLVERYPRSVAAREALLYSLMMERTAHREKSTTFAKEAQDLVIDLRKEVTETSPLVDLVASQIGIDQDNLADARENLERFLQRWDGEPGILMAYVEELQRYIRSHL